MHIQAQQISASNTSSSNDALNAPSSQVVVPHSPATEFTFEEWTINSSRLAAIKEVSASIAGEIPAYERYVEAQNTTRGLDSQLYVLRDLNQTPSAYNYYDKLQEALEKRDSNISLAA